MREKRDRYLSFYKESQFLKFRQYYLERDILRTAFTVFEAEKQLKRKGTIRRIHIPISQQTYERINRQDFCRALKDLFLLILLENIEVILKPIDDISRRKRKRAKVPQKEAVILFSGGIDSYAGIKSAEKKYRNLIGIFVAHNDQKRIISIVNNLKRSIKTEIRTVYAPGMGASGYSQMRGFLYILCAGVYLSLCKTNTIIVTECGPTMYQPLFSPFDSITYTTHPYVLQAAKDVLEILLGFKVNICIPFEDLTKAEIISNSRIRDFSLTHSCITQMFADHEGTCFGCVIRKLATLVSGAKDVEYNKNVFDDAVNQDNLLHLLSFSDDIIHNYKDMPEFQKDKIEEFEKYDLFYRYALDNFAGLMLGVSKTHILYKRYIKKEEKLLRSRIKQVRLNPRKPNFKKFV